MKLNWEAVPIPTYYGQEQHQPWPIATDEKKRPIFKISCISSNPSPHSTSMCTSYLEEYAKADPLPNGLQLQVHMADHRKVPGVNEHAWVRLPTRFNNLKDCISFAVEQLKEHSEYLPK